MKKHYLPIKTATLVDEALVLFNTKQINAFWQKTPPKYIKERPAKGGGNWNYVSGAYMRSQLDRVFGYNWTFEIKSFTETNGQIVAHGRLTGYIPYSNPDGVAFHPIVKEDFGRADIKLQRGTPKPLDIGNDYKASATDAMKRCAMQFGIARDVYSNNEFAEIEFVDKNTIREHEAEAKIDALTKDIDKQQEALDQDE